MLQRTLTDRETAAYVCLEKTEGLTLPTAEEILRDGKAIAPDRATSLSKT